MAVKIALIDAKLYVGTAGSSAGSLVTNVRDLSLKMKKGEAKCNNRASRWAKVKGTLKEVEIEWEMNDDDSDTALSTFISAFTNDTPVAIRCLDGTSGHGMDGDFEVFTCERDEKLEEGLVYKIGIKPCPSTRDLAWI